jgi:hypothetical protein
MQTMGVSIHWNETQPHAVILTLSEEWTWRELTHEIDAALKLADRLSHRVLLIGDMTHTTYLPATGLVDIVRQSAQKIHQHHNIMGVVLAMPPTSMRDMLTTVIKTYSGNTCDFEAVNTMDEAYQLSREL